MFNKAAILLLVSVQQPMKYTLPVDSPMLMQFGLSYEQVDRNVEFSKAYLDNVEYGKAVNVHWECVDWVSWHKAARYHHECWEELQIAMRCPVDRNLDNNHAKHLYELLGAKNFNRGIMPPPVPLQYFREIGGR